MTHASRVIACSGLLWVGALGRSLWVGALAGCSTRCSWSSESPGLDSAFEQLSVEGNHGFIVWSAETADNVYELGTDTFFVQGGKIQMQSFAGKITRKR